MQRLSICAVAAACLLLGCGPVPKAEKPPAGSSKQSVAGTAQPAEDRKAPGEAGRTGVSRSFIGPPQLASKAPLGVLKFFNDVPIVASKGDPAEVAKILDVDAMTEVLKADGGLPPDVQDSDAEAEFARGLASGLATGLAQSAKAGAGWKRWKIRSIRYLAPKTELVASASVWNAEGVETTMRWWLIEKDGVWRGYDCESSEHGVRLSVMMGMATTKPGPRLDAMKEVLAAHGQVRAGELEAAVQRLNALKGVSLPLDFEAARWTTLATAQNWLGKYEESIESAERALALKKDIAQAELVYASDLNQLGRPREAIARIGRYSGLIGEDSHYVLQLGCALIAIGEVETPRRLFERLSDDDPKNGDLVFQMFRCNPQPPYSGLLLRYRRLGGVAERFKEFAELFLSAENGESLAALVEVQKKVLPDDPNISKYEKALVDLQADAK